jgi:polyisoprenoid-binding protein YceI
MTTTSTDTLPAGHWTVDPARSEVTFETRAMGGLFPVHGRFDRFTGALNVDEQGHVDGDLVIEAETIKTGIGKRDAHLRTKDFFHAEAHPQVTFALTEVRATDGRVTATGTLHIRDRSLPISTPLTVTQTGDELRLEADFVVDHDAAGLGWAKPIMVRKHVDARVRLALRK